MSVPRDPQVPPGLTAEPVAEILRSGVFDLAAYCAASALPAHTSAVAAITHYVEHGEAQGLHPHALFDPAYVEQQLAALNIAPLPGGLLRTYLAHPQALLDPHPLFDSAFYNLRNPDVAARNTDALIHYLRTGWKEHRQPHPLFEGGWWRQSLATLGLDAPLGNPLVAYLTNPATWRASTHPLFDPACFAQRLAHAELEPLEGVPPLVDLLQRQPEVSPHRLFDPAWYRTQAAALAMPVTGHALVDYLRGKGAGLIDPHPLFSDRYYLGMYADVAANAVAPLEHFVRSGEAAGRSPNPLFSHKHYRANRGVPSGETRLLEHYLDHGRDLLDPHPLFYARSYALRYPECLEPGDTPLAHYSRTWAEQGVSFPPWGTALYPRRTAPRDVGAPEVVLVSHELSRTGAPLILLRILEDLVARRGLRALVLALQGGELLEDFCEWAPTLELTRPRAAGIGEAAFMASLRASLCGQRSPGLMIVNTACVDRTVVNLGADVPLVSLVHELAGGFPEEWFRTIYERSGLVIYPAEFVREEAHALYALPSGKAAVAPQGLLDPRFGQGDAASARAALRLEIGAPADAFVVLGCGTLDQRKGLDTFVHMARAMLRGPLTGDARPLHFVWVGGGPTGPQSVGWFARQDVERSGLTGRVHLLGPRTTTERYFLGSDAFVMTSRMDPFPCVIHEAMACAIPVIVFGGAGGAPEALQGGAGIVVPYGDIAQMSAEILRLRADPQGAAALGARAREAVHRRYVFSDYVDRLLKLADERLGFRAVPPKALPARRTRARVVVAASGLRAPGLQSFPQSLVAALCARGFDAEVILTGHPREVRLSSSVPRAPQRLLALAAGQPLLHRKRWEALTRILEVAAPVVLVHGLDPLAAALAPLPLSGVGVLSVLEGAGEAQHEQVARLSRYWQRAVVTSAALSPNILAAAPQLAGRLMVMPLPGAGQAEDARAWDSWAQLLAEMLEELRSGAYIKPAPLHEDPVFGALSLPPEVQRDPVQLGFSSP